MNDYFERRGNIWLVVITAIEFLFYVAYTVLYGFAEEQSITHDINMQIYRWCLTAVLMIAILYFMFQAVRSLG
jgi:polyferredoxin